MSPTEKPNPAAIGYRRGHSVMPERQIHTDAEVCPMVVLIPRPSMKVEAVRAEQHCHKRSWHPSHPRMASSANDDLVSVVTGWTQNGHLKFLENGNPSSRSELHPVLHPSAFSSPRLSHSFDR
ncbi:hypothetical protein CIRG_09436 [Coccidioides immitis RMSCC 2394]|uniref:Uncharacterized protein n=1 Tax=Coccidioides immitis RMSCC 2394 TaxID=404692 RepID=A0A0J6YKU2_COCIT|nr:hypothetical protein CIRG_09436 [Coccidioides immitis RMSCC 2394]